MIALNATARFAAASLALCAGVASAQTYTPLAFGPVPGNFGGNYVRQISDISADGTVVAGQLSDFTSFTSGPAGVTSLGFTTTMFVSNDGQTIIGQRFVSASNQPVVRWTLGSGVGTDLPMQAVSLNAINSDATRFLVNGALRNAANGIVSPAPTFPVGIVSWGFPHMLASRAPISGGGGGPDNSGYRYNYDTGLIQTFQAVPGTSATFSPNGMSGDGTITVGTASVSGVNPRPVYWDANGLPHVIPFLPSATAGLGSCVNDIGTLIGGNAGRAGGLDSAFVYSVELNQTIDIGQIFRDAGMVPAGWRLVATSHISDEGSRIFCTAIAPDGSSRFVMLSGTLNLPTPGAAALLGLGGVLASRRRRSA